MTEYDNDDTVRENAEGAEGDLLTIQERHGVGDDDGAVSADEVGTQPAAEVLEHAASQSESGRDADAPAVADDEQDEDERAPAAVTAVSPLDERMAEVRARVARNRTSVKGEETIKSGLVMPFIMALGYDVFDPAEVTPAYAPENGQRIDYAIRDGDDVRMIISVSSTPSDLGTDRARRLGDAMASTGTRCAILTDGTVYRFHSDVGTRGVMDGDPLFTLDLTSEGQGYPAALSSLCRETFDPVRLIEIGSEEKRIAAVRHAVGDELADPSETFVELIRRHLDRVGITTDASLAGMINAVTLPLSRRMDEATVQTSPGETSGTPAVGDDRIMTREETDGYNIVRALCARYINPDRVVARPAKSYCAILLDDNNRKSIVRLHFNSQTIKHLGTFVNRDETRNQIQSTSAIYDHEELIMTRIRELDPQSATS